MSDYCGTVYFFETLDSHERTEHWSVFYDVDAAMFVAERTNEDSDYVTGAATAADLQEALDGQIPPDVLARVAASATNERRAITVTFTEADGARILGAPRDEDTTELLTANRWHWSDADRSWSVPRSRDTAARTLLIDTTAQWLRDAGHHVTVRVEGRQDEPTHRS